MTFAGNHLGHYIMTCKFKGLLFSSENPVVVNVSSSQYSGVYGGKIDFDDEANPPQEHYNGNKS